MFVPVVQETNQRNPTSLVHGVETMTYPNDGSGAVVGRFDVVVGVVLVAVGAAENVAGAVAGTWLASVSLLSILATLSAAFPVQFSAL